MKPTLRLIGVPLDLGQTHRGVDMGPGALRYARLAERLGQLGYGINDTGNLVVPVREALGGESALHFLPSIARVCGELYQAAGAALAAGEIPLFLGGDHALAIGSIGGVTAGRSTGVLWVDAHGDFNTPQSSPSGNIHGMPLATLLGQGYPELVNLGRRGAKLRADDVVLIGVRELDPGEREALRASGLRVYTMRDIDERGIGGVVREALQVLEHCRHLHLSFDVDVLDPQVAAGVGTPTPGGISYREAQLLMELLADSGRVGSLDLVEVNPVRDRYNQTATVAAELVASLFGKAIL